MSLRRQRGAQRRGDGARRLSLHDTQPRSKWTKRRLGQPQRRTRRCAAIDSALTRLEKLEAPQSRIVELRYFGGLTLDETASVTGISLASVKREWAIARAWLRRELATS